MRALRGIAAKPHDDLVKRAPVRRGQGGTLRADLGGVGDSHIGQPTAALADLPLPRGGGRSHRRVRQRRIRRRRIVVGVDGSDGSRVALRWAVDEAELRDVELEAVMARMPAVPLPLFGPGSLPVPASTAPLDRATAARRDEESLEAMVREVLGDRRSQRVTWDVEEGHPVGVLLGRSAGADLLVLGARGGGGFTELLAGSVSEQCVRHARCTVAVVRPQR